MGGNEAMREIGIGKIKEELEQEKGADNKIALLHGCFDGLHPGHLALLRKTRKIAEIVVVGIESDEYVRRCKGDHRPHFDVKDRIEALRRTGLVDYLFIIPIASDTGIYRRLYTELSPNFLVTAQDEVLDKKKN